MIDDIQCVIDSPYEKKYKSNIYNYYSNPSKRKIEEYDRLIGRINNGFSFIYTTSKYNFTVIDVESYTKDIIKFKYFTYKYYYYIEFDTNTEKILYIARLSR